MKEQIEVPQACYGNRIQNPSIHNSSNSNNNKITQPLADNGRCVAERYGMSINRARALTLDDNVGPRVRLLHIILTSQLCTT